MRISDWSSDVCSSDLAAARREPASRRGGRADHARRRRDQVLDGAELVSRRRARQGRHLQLRHQARRLPRAQRSEEHTSELQSLMRISYAVFCLKKKKTNETTQKT